LGAPLGSSPHIGKSLLHLRGPPIDAHSITAGP
jgi:hypothetical protein